MELIQVDKQSRKTGFFEKVLKEASGAKLAKVPAYILDDMVKDGLAERTKNKYVFVDFGTPQGHYYLLYEPFAVASKSEFVGARLKSVKYEKSLAGPDAPETDRKGRPWNASYYRLIYATQSTKRIVKERGQLTTVDMLEGPPGRGENFERAWRIAREEKDWVDGRTRTQEFLRGLVPFRNTIKYWDENSALENTLSLTGDALLFLGPLSRVIAGANAARTALRITIAAEAALGAVRAGQGVYDLTYGDGTKATRFFSEAALRLLGVSAATIQLLKLPNTGAAGVAKLSPWDFEAPKELRMGMSRRAFDKLKADIAKNGMQEPIKYLEYQGKKYIVDGYHRQRIAKQLGLNEVPAEKVELPYKGYQTIKDVLAE